MTSQNVMQTFIYFIFNLQFRSWTGNIFQGWAVQIYLAAKFIVLWTTNFKQFGGYTVFDSIVSEEPC